MFPFSKRKNTIIYLIFLLLAVGSIISCRKNEKIDSSPSLKLSFSTDTVFFDTVFTSVGSVTKRLLVYNKNDNKVMISSILLAGGQNSSFSLNIDGTPAISVSDVEIPGHDSLFIFVRVTVDPSNQDNPLIITDSILFVTNSNQQDVKLVAWGQDAHFYKNAQLQGNVVWDSLKPHVIYGSVRVDTSSMLTVLPGTKVYFHKAAYLAVSYDGSLKISGNLDHPVRFQGDRLDPFYKDLPGQWDGIYLEKGCRDNEINYAIIKNGIFGLEVDTVRNASQPTLKIDNTIIQNMTGTGIYAYASNIISTNCVIGDCGGGAVAVVSGGTYDFRQLTIGNYWSASVRFAPSLYLSNYSFDQLGNKIPNAMVKSYFGNTILYGNQDEEIMFDTVTSAPFAVTFDHCLLKTQEPTSNPSRYIECIINQDPVFINIQTFDYRIDSISPAIDKGVPMGVDYDIKGAFRGQSPDLGAYEYMKR